MLSASCCQFPLIRIENYEYGSIVKSSDFHLAPLEDMKSRLPYPHRHNFYHIVWIATGSGHHIIDSIRYTVRPDTLFFMAPGQIHDFDLSEQTTGFALSFSPEFLSFKTRSRHSTAHIPIFEREHIRDALYLNQAQAADLRRLLDGIIEEYYAEADGFEDVIWSYLRILLIQAERLAGAAGENCIFSRNQLLSRRFKSLLEQQASTVHDAAAYARMLNVTERTLNSATRDTLGKTAAKLIREHVMLEAKRMLLFSEETIAEVANQLAFEDPAYFSRCFKKHTGRSPLEFRQSLARLNT